MGQPWARRPRGHWAHRGLLPSLWGPRLQPGTPKPPCGFLPQPVHPAQPTVPAPDPYNRHPGGVSCPWTSAPCEPPGPSQHFWEGLLSPALARARGAGDAARPSPQAGMPPCHPTQCLPRAHLPISCSATAWMAVVCPSAWAWASPPPGLRAKGPAGRCAGAGEAPSPNPTHTLSSQSSFTARLPGFRSWGQKKGGCAAPPARAQGQGPGQQLNLGASG